MDIFGQTLNDCNSEIVAQITALMQQLREFFVSETYDRNTVKQVVFNYVDASSNFPFSITGNFIDSAPSGQSADPVTGVYGRFTLNTSLQTSFNCLVEAYYNPDEVGIGKLGLINAESVSTRDASVAVMALLYLKKLYSEISDMSDFPGNVATINKS